MTIAAESYGSAPSGTAEIQRGIPTHRSSKAPDEHCSIPRPSSYCKHGSSDISYQLQYHPARAYRQWHCDTATLQHSRPQRGNGSVAGMFSTFLQPKVILPNPRPSARHDLICSWV
ncbi:hypothetical protein BU23DRAFT_291203 [Bimuria novae-zelandiae CBS 107.79]|uniref:Uncharacterized protein n=1 Tax=Bimuria novae-zelandiae CBS 107.79 TaxID=1447943 RepID=A0A6A5US46_9PLEO|nr:hypothetical protein BU23DRAFT_291203 [Bimuria novae-zelandiae CBS 107.79]